MRRERVQRAFQAGQPLRARESLCRVWRSPTNNLDREFSGIVARQLRRPAFLTTPAFLLRSLFGEMATVLLEGQPAVPQKLLGLGYNFRFAEVDSALQG